MKRFRIRKRCEVCGVALFASKELRPVCPRCYYRNRSGREMNASYHKEKEKLPEGLEYVVRL